MKTTQGFVWKLAERILSQGIKFIVQLFLARLIMPEEYGILAILLVFVSFADIIAQSGLNTALIQKNEIDDKDVSSVFWFSLIFATFTYLILFILAPAIALFYENEILTPTLRILSVSIFFVTINSIQIAKVSRKFDFRAVFITSLISCVTSGIISIFLAYQGLGIGALVVYQLMSCVVNVIVMMPFAKMKIFVKPSIERLKHLLPFGMKLMVSYIIATATENLYNLILGKKYNTELVGYYTRGQQFPLAISTSVNTTISSVLLPYLSQKQDNIDGVREIARKSVSMSTYLIFPMLGGLFVIADLMISVLLTDKWLPCVPFLRLECLFYATIPMMNAAGQGYIALGRSDLSLKIEAFKSVTTILFIFLIINFANVYWVVGVRSIISLITFFLQVYFTSKVYGYTLLNRFSDIIPNLIITIIMSFGVYLLSKVFPPSFGALFFLCLVGVGLFLLLSIATRNKNFYFIIKTIKIYINSNTNTSETI